MLPGYDLDLSRRRGKLTRIESKTMIASLEYVTSTKI